MSDVDYTSKILSRDLEAQTFVVEYTRGESVIPLNLPLPESEEVIDATVAKYAPIRQWAKLDQLGEEVQRVVLPPVYRTVKIAAGSSYDLKPGSKIKAMSGECHLKNDLPLPESGLLLVDLEGEQVFAVTETCLIEWPTHE